MIQMENYFLLARWTLERDGKCLKDTEQGAAHGHFTPSGKDFILALNSALRTWSITISLKEPRLLFG